MSSINELHVPMGLIESYVIEEDGFNPFLIKDSWQVAKLNYSKEHHINNIDRVTIHKKNDRAFNLLKGNAVLILVDVMKKEPSFSFKLMQRGISYNIPENVAYAVAMQKGSELFIVEKANAHKEDLQECKLNAKQLKTLRVNVNKVFNR